MGITAAESLPEIRIEAEPLDLEKVISGERVPEVLRPKPIDPALARRALPEMGTTKTIESGAKRFGNFAQALQGLNVKPIDAGTKVASGEVTFTDIGTVKQWAKELEGLGDKDAWIDRFAETFEKAGYSPKEAREHAMVEWNLQKARLEKLLKEGAVVDTNIPGKIGEHVQVMDHHGPFARKENGKLQKANATMLLLNRIQQALREVGVKDLQHPTPAEIQKAKAKLGIKWVTTDNLADGAEAVWIVQNLERVLSGAKLSFFKGASLPSAFRRIGDIVDVKVWGNNYDRNSPEVMFAGALFGRYEAILQKYVAPKLKTGEHLTSDRLDRLNPDEARLAMGDATRSINELLEKAENDPAALKHEADVFFKRVDAAKADAAKSLIDRVVDPLTGRALVNFYNQANMAAHGLFPTWVVYSELQRGMPEAEKAPIQVNTFPMGEGKSMVLIAIPNGLKVSSKGGLLPLKEALGPEFNGKDNVLFAFTTTKSLAEIKAVLADPKFGLFKGPALSPADVEAWATGLGNFFLSKARDVLPGMGEAPKATPADPVRTRNFRRIDSSPRTAAPEPLQTTLGHIAFTNQFLAEVDRPETRQSLQALAQVPGPVGEWARDFSLKAGEAGKWTANAREVLDPNKRDAALARFRSEVFPTVQQLREHPFYKGILQSYGEIRRSFEPRFSPLMAELTAYTVRASGSRRGKPLFQVHYASPSELRTYIDADNPNRSFFNVPTEKLASIDLFVTEHSARQALLDDLGTRLNWGMRQMADGRIEVTSPERDKVYLRFVTNN